MSHNHGSSSNHPCSEDEFLNCILQGYKYAQLLYVAARTGIADVLKEGAKASEELAQTMGLDALVLGRVMRGLGLCGFVARDDNGRFVLTSFGERFQTDAPGSLREWAIFMGEIYYPAWAGLLNSLESGQSAFGHIFGTGAFEYFEKNPDIGFRFNELMNGDTLKVAQIICEAYNFSTVWKIVDIGGGHGALLNVILTTYPHLSGILFDKPLALRVADQRFKTAEIQEKCRLIAGDFFVAVPTGGDLYILKGVIQDWSDAQAARILKNCRRAMKKKMKLLVIERIVPEQMDNPQNWIDTDLHLLVLTGGRERTLKEHERLLAGTGFCMIRLIPTACPLCIIEAEAC